MATESTRDVRIVILGDALVSPQADPKGMGWVGRVISKTQRGDRRFDFFSLAAPDETTNMLSDRWADEVKRRFSVETQNYLVLALSNADPAAGISISRSRLNVATILDESKRAGISCLVVGPTPSRNPELNYEIEHLATGFEDVANRRGVPFVDCFRPLIEHEGWNQEINELENGQLGQIGHGLIAWLVLNRGWFDWLGIQEND